MGLSCVEKPVSEHCTSRPVVVHASVADTALVNLSLNVAVKLMVGKIADAIIEGTESPYMPGASVVAIHLNSAATFAPFMQTFLYVQQASDIQGSTSMLLGTRFQSFNVGAKVYRVGTLPPWTRLMLWFAQVPWLAAIILLILAFLVAVWLRNWLRMKARARLKMLD